MNRLHGMVVGCLVLVAMWAGGCASMQSYELSVKNQTDKPLTLWLTKQGDEREAAWLPPEALATSNATDVRTIGGIVVMPGKTGFTPQPVKGSFSGHDQAILRVYSNAMTLDQVLAMSRRSPNRIDVPLLPGKTALIIHDRTGKLEAAPAGK